MGASAGRAPTGEPREIDWSTAVVKDGALAVELTGAPSRQWSEHMQGVLERLARGPARTIRVTKRRIRVPAVSEDSAAELRHLLEGAVQQTNADLASEPAGVAADEQAQSPDPDQLCGEAFRAFASRPEA